MAQNYTSTNPLAPVEFDEVFVTPFFTATGGRAKMSASLPVTGLFTPPTNYFNVQHGASLRPGPLAPGSLAFIKGQFSNTNAYPVSFFGVPQVAYTLNGISVQLDGTNLRLYSVLTTGINAAIPQNATRGAHTLTVTSNGTVVFTQQIAITNANIGAFTWSPDPNHPQDIAPQIVNANGQLIGNPSLSSKYVQVGTGDSVTILTTGGGATTPPMTADNTPLPPSGTYSLNAYITISIDGAFGFTVTSAIRQPGSFSRDQITFTVPSGLASGPHSIELNVMVGYAPGGKVYKDALWIK